jgi:endonuclease/exonuclease/phosphatase family metal-dependent hydrolase
VRNTLLPIVGKVETTTEATGLANVYGNKGGVGIALMIKDTRLCFISSHLAAHQNKTAERNADVKQIIQGLHFGDDKMDCLHQFHHVFWMGDLNYRLAYGTQGDAKTPSHEQFNEMVKKIGEKKIGELLPTDQLAAEIKASRVFLGFQEGKIAFSPTFKVQRDKALKYDEERSPAWCDRVLVKSIPGHKVAQSGYGSAEIIGTSDHKPVWATYTLDYMTIPSGIDDTWGACEVILTKLKASNVLVGDIGGTSDPFLRIHAPFLLKPVQTPTKKKTLQPEWGDTCPPLKLLINSKERLRRSFLMIKVFDADHVSETILGYTMLTLEQGLDGLPKAFTIPFLQGGLPAGTLEGTMQIKWGKPTFEA